MSIKVLETTDPWEWDETAGGLIISALTEQTAPPDDRLLAASLAGEIVVLSEELVEALLSVLRDDNESEELRAQAAISLGPILEFVDTELEDLEDLGMEDDEPPSLSEQAFSALRQALHELYHEEAVPSLVRRRVLEASARAPQDWHAAAIQEAYASDDLEWRRTAVFAMRWVIGFEKEILESLKSSDLGVHFEAVEAAGSWELEAAWPHVQALLSEQTEKPLLLAAIEAAAGIRPEEAGTVLVDLVDSADEEIAEAAQEAMAAAEIICRLEEEEAEEDEELN